MPFVPKSAHAPKKVIGHNPDNDLPASKPPKERAKKTIKKVTEDVEELRHKAIIAEDTLEAAGAIINKLVISVSSLTDVNDFLSWVKILDAGKYPAQKAAIDRVQKFKRPSLVIDVFELVQIFLRERTLENSS